jgi:hypothetical protein
MLSIKVKRIYAAGVLGNVYMKKSKEMRIDNFNVIIYKVSFVT